MALQVCYNQRSNTRAMLISRGTFDSAVGHVARQRHSVSIQPVCRARTNSLRRLKIDRPQTLATQGMASLQQASMAQNASVMLCSFPNAAACAGLIRGVRFWLRSAWAERNCEILSLASIPVAMLEIADRITQRAILHVSQKAVVRACRNAIEFNSIPSVERLVPGGRNGLKLKIKVGTPFPVRAKA